MNPSNYGTLIPDICLTFPSTQKHELFVCLKTNEYIKVLAFVGIALPFSKVAKTPKNKINIVFIVSSWLSENRTQ
jgi:hypothetical protein